MAAGSLAHNGSRNASGPARPAAGPLPKHPVPKADDYLASNLRRDLDPGLAAAPLEAQRGARLQRRLVQGGVTAALQHLHPPSLRIDQQRDRRLAADPRERKSGSRHGPVNQ
jgi:hypothetical protein